MRLIDGNALLHHKRKMIGEDFSVEFWDEAVLVSDIQNAPTIDAVPVVRCKDCKHRYQYEDWDRDRAESFVCHECRLHQKDFGEDGFCSYGERKDGSEDV